MTATKTDTAAVLEVLVPGLFGPVPLPPELAPATPVLDRILARGDALERPGSDLTTALLARFGAAASAPYALAAEPDATDVVAEPSPQQGGFWMHADPVHLRPDRDQLRLFDARHLGISRAEADALVAELNAHFGGDGLRFIAPDAARWYLTTARPPCLHTQPLEQVIGRSIDGRLPSGPDAEHWAALMNELQMLLFQSPVNRAREQHGRPPVNGVWTWGGGEWRQLDQADAPDRLQAAGPLETGLARAAGSAVEPLPAAAAPAPGTTLAVFDRLRDAVLDTDETAWASAAAALDQWLAAALAALRRGMLDEIIVDACDGRGLRLRRAHLLRLWRPRRRLVQRLDAAPR
jgi:hypothetical protein